MIETREGVLSNRNNVQRKLTIDNKYDNDVKLSRMIYADQLNKHQNQQNDTREITFLSSTRSV